MGCSPSLSLGFEFDGERQLESGMLDHFSILEPLGRGSFGSVCMCRKRLTGEKLAVKIVDTRRHCLDELVLEADIMQKLSHRGIVRFHNLYYEDALVYIVMDAYLGGDLVDGLHRRMQKGPLTDSSQVVHIQRQMVESVEYLHAQGVVHRDIKGDNLLIDREDITDPGCHVALADFGAACSIAPRQRLRKKVGTPKFSAPELSDRCYGEKVDTWALGVVMYGLACGRFPFRNEKEVRCKVVRMDSHVDGACQDLILRLLEKREDCRPTAAEAAAHPWLRRRARNSQQQRQQQQLQQQQQEQQEQLGDKAASESESTTVGDTGDEEESQPFGDAWRSRPLERRGRGGGPGGDTAAGEEEGRCEPAERGGMGVGAPAVGLPL